MRTWTIVRSFLAIVFVGIVGTAVAKEYSGIPVIALPEGCTSPASCGAVCAQRPESCVDYCVVNAANAVECGRWANAYHAGGGVTIAQAFAPPAGGMSFSPAPSSSSGGNFSPPSGGSGMSSSPSSGSMMNNSPMGSPMGGPQTVGDQQQMGQPSMGTGMGSQPGMTQGQQGMMSPSTTGGQMGDRGMPAFSGSGTQGQMNQMPGQSTMGNQSGMMGQPGLTGSGSSGFEGGKKPPGGMMNGTGMQTCNVNGVEIPGRCEDVQGQQMSKSMGIPLGGGLTGTGPGGCASPEQCSAYCEKGDNKQGCDGFFKNFQSAPRDFQNHEQSRPELQQQTGQSKEEFEKQRQEGDERFAKEQEEQQKRVQEQMLRQMKQGMQQMNQMIKQLERRINDLVKRKVKISAEVTSAMAQLKELVVKAQNITDPSEMGEIGPQIGELVQTINEQFGDLERLAEFPRMIAQANKMIRQFEAQFKRLEARVKARKLDVGDALTEAKALLEEVKKSRDDAKVQAAQGNAEEAFELLQSGIFDRGEDLQEKMFGLEIVVNAPAEITRAGRELRRIEARIKQLERRQQDMTEAKAFLAQAKTLFDAVKGLVKQRPMPAEELMAQVEEFEGLMEQIRDEIGEDDTPKFKPYELELPAGLPVAPTASAATEAAPAQ